MFYAELKYYQVSTKYYQEKTKIRYFFERIWKNEMIRSQKNETLTSLLKIAICHKLFAMATFGLISAADCIIFWLYLLEKEY
jgi:hypothetical protein